MYGHDAVTHRVLPNQLCTRALYCIANLEIVSKCLRGLACVAQHVFNKHSSNVHHLSLCKDVWLYTSHVYLTGCFGTVHKGVCHFDSGDTVAAIKTMKGKLLCSCITVVIHKHIYYYYTVASESCTILVLCFQT